MKRYKFDKDNDGKPLDNKSNRLLFAEYLDDEATKREGWSRRYLEIASLDTQVEMFDNYIENLINILTARSIAKYHRGLFI